MEQLSFDIDVSDERKAFDLVYPHLQDIIYNAPADSNVLVFKELENCSSVYFLNSNMRLFQIRMRKKNKYLLLPESCVAELPEGTVVERVKSEEGMIRVPLESPEDILRYASQLRSILDKTSRKYHEFACCSRYEACSDAKTCIHPDVIFALGCQYRHNLMDGKIFYGKNKNID